MATITLQPAGVTVTIKDLDLGDLEVIAEALMHHTGSPQSLYRLFDRAHDQARRMIDHRNVEVTDEA